jgi:predicted enzyme related to lactoylglutathione lyase
METNQGSFVWNELMSKDAEAAVKFYKELFGWNTKQHTLHTGYQIIIKDGKEIGGIMQMDAEFGDTPSHWLPYVSVGNVDETVEKVKQLGGTVCVPPTDIPSVGRFSVVSDPSGGTLSIITLLP